MPLDLHGLTFGQTIPGPRTEPFRFPAGIYRTDEQLRKRAIAAADEVGSDLNKHITAFLEWLVGDTDELPPRPGHRVTNVPGQHT